MTIRNKEKKAEGFSSKVATYFDDLAPSWSMNYRPNGSMQARIQLFADALQANGVQKGASVLDFGCGSGVISCALAELGYKVTGADISEHMIKMARQNSANQSIDWLNLTPGQLSLPFHDAAFDVVIASSVLEYVPAPAQLINEFHRVLRTGGTIACTVPDERHPVRVAERAWLGKMKKPFASIVLRLLPSFLPIRRRFDYLSLSVTRWSPGQWQIAFRNAGFIAEIKEQYEHPLMLVKAKKD